MPADSISFFVCESVMPPAAQVVPSVPSLSMDNMQAPRAFSAARAKPSTNSCDGPPCPFISLSSKIVVTASPALSTTHGAAKGCPYSWTSRAIDAIMPPASLASHSMNVLRTTALSPMEAAASFAYMHESGSVFIW